MWFVCFRKDLGIKEFNFPEKEELKIFIKDILKLYRYSDRTSKHEFLAFAEVKFYMGMFCLEYVVPNSYILDNKGNHLKNKIKRSFDNLWRPGESYEVIGNIHESTEEQLKEWGIEK